MKIAVEKSNDELFVHLPAEATAHLGWGHGDILKAELVDDCLKITRSMAAHDHALHIAREAMDEYRETLEALAKS